MLQQELQQETSGKTTRTDYADIDLFHTLALTCRVEKMNHFLQLDYNYFRHFRQAGTHV